MRWRVSAAVEARSNMVRLTHESGKHCRNSATCHLAHAGYLARTSYFDPPRQVPYVARSNGTKECGGSGERPKIGQGPRALRGLPVHYGSVRLIRIRWGGHRVGRERNRSPPEQPRSRCGFMAGTEQR